MGLCFIIGTPISFLSLCMGRMKADLHREHSHFWFRNKTNNVLTNNSGEPLKRVTPLNLDTLEIPFPVKS
jgi:hypothetical protein